MKRRLAIAVVLSFSLSVAASATERLPSTEFWLSEPYVADAPFSRSGLSMVAGHSRILAVWRDGRAGGFSQSKIWASRMSRDGAVLDPIGFVVSDAIGVGDPSVTWNGSTFLVAWPAGSATSLASVSESGVITPLPGIALSGRVSMASDGNTSLLVVSPSTQLYISKPPHAVILDREGRAIAPPVKLGTSSFFSASVAATPNGYFVTGGTDWRSIVAFRVATVGKVKELLTTENTGFGHAMGSDGNRMLVAYSAGSPSRLTVRMLAGDGASLGAPVAIAPNTEAPVVIWTGTQYVVSYITAGAAEVATHRFDANGVRLDDAPLIVGSGSRISQIALTPLDGDIAFGTVSHSSFHSAINARVFRPDGRTMSDVVTLSKGYPHQSHFSSAWNGSEYISAWIEASDRLRVVMGGIRPMGKPHDGRGVVLAHAQTVSVAAGKENAFIVWPDDDSGQFEGVIVVRENGSLKIAATVRIPRDPALYVNDVTALWNGTEYAVFWREGFSWISGARITANGLLLESGRVAQIGDLPRVSPFDSADKPVAAWTGTEYLLAWRVIEGPEQPGYQSTLVYPKPIYGLRVSRELNASGPRFVISRAHASQPVVANYGGDTWLSWVRWSDGKPPFREEEGLRVSRFREGVALDPLNGRELAPVWDQPIGTVLQDGLTVYTTRSAWRVLPSGDSLLAPSLVLPFDVKHLYDTTMRSTEPTIVGGGPAPLAIYRTPSRADRPLVGRFVVAPRTRAVGR